MTNILHIYKRIILFLANFTSSILPPTQFFKLKTFLYNRAGLDVHSEASIVGGAKFYFYNIKVGEKTWIGTSTKFITSMKADIVIGKNVDIAPGVYINTGSHIIGLSDRRAGENIANSIYIGDGTWIGMGALILGGSNIGKGCVVAAAVVKGEFPDDVIIGSIPAKIIKNLEKGEK